MIDNNESILLVNSTTASKLNHGHIIHLLSIPNKGNPLPPPSSTKKIVCKKIEKHILCCLSKISRSSVGSLVVRRANGGAPGNDVRVIAKHPHWTVDLRGIVDHK